MPAPENSIFPESLSAILSFIMIKTRDMSEKILKIVTV